MSINAQFSGWLLISLACLSQLAYGEVKLPTATKAVTTTPAELLGTNENNLGLKKGDQVPSFTSHTFEGKETALSEMLESAPLLVIFYRGGWCPYCNFQIRQLAQHHAEFEKREVTPVLISVDKADAASLVKKSYEIPFPVMSDPGLEAHEAFNVVLALDDALYKRYQGYGLDLEEWSGEAHHKIAVSSAFLVDKSGTVQWSHVATDYKTRPSPQQLLGAIDTWRQGK